jgi:hypothetical protein
MTRMNQPRISLSLNPGYVSLDCDPAICQTDVMLRSIWIAMRRDRPLQLALAAMTVLLWLWFSAGEHSVVVTARCVSGC